VADAASPQGRFGGANLRTDGQSAGTQIEFKIPSDIIGQLKNIYFSVKVESP
jgi:hypothetical protein